jgi:hypothetical protein
MLSVYVEFQVFSNFHVRSVEIQLRRSRLNIKIYSVTVQFNRMKILSRVNTEEVSKIRHKYIAKANEKEMKYYDLKRDDVNELRQNFPLLVFILCAPDTKFSSSFGHYRDTSG